MTPTPFAEQIADWHDFYAAVTGMAATLVGLLFVGLGLNPGVMVAGSPTGLRVLAGQTFHNFLIILVIAVVALIPEPSADVLAITLLVVGVQGVLLVGRDLYRTLTDADREWSRLRTLSRHAAPAVAYAFALWVGFDLLDGRSDDLGAIVVTIFLLLISASVNCWEILAAIGERRSQGDSGS